LGTGFVSVPVDFFGVFFNLRKLMWQQLYKVCYYNVGFG
jgi:hypothetical protein